MFIGSNQQQLIVHENVKQEKVLFSYNLQLYIKHLYKIKSCQVIVKSRPFYVYLGI